MVLLVKNPLYGIPESGLHCPMNYLEHHLGKLGMARRRSDPCVLVKLRDGKLEGMVTQQLDDSMEFGPVDFTF